MARAYLDRPRGAIKSWGVMVHFRYPERVGQKSARVQVESEADGLALRDEVRALDRQGEDWLPPKLRRRLELRSQPTVGEMMMAWLDEMQDTRATNTMVRYTRDVSVFLRFLSDRYGPAAHPNGEVLTRSTMKAFWDWLGKPETSVKNRKRPPSEWEPRSDTTREKLLQTAQRFVNWAASEDEFRNFVKPIGKLYRPAVLRPRSTAPTFGQMASCIEAALDLPVKRALLLMYYTGLRPTLQVMQLKWSDFTFGDPGRAMLKMRPEICKTADEKSEARLIPICRHLALELLDWAKQDGVLITEGKAGSKTYLVPSNRSRRELRGRDVKRAWVRSKAGWDPDWRSPSMAFRHGFDTGLLQRRANPHAVSHLLGHKDMALVYNTYAEKQTALWDQMKEALALIPHHTNPEPRGTKRTVTEEFLHPERNSEGAEVVVLKEWAG